MQPKDFNITEQEKFTDLVLVDSIKKLPFIKFWWSIKEENPQLPEKKLLKYSFPSPTLNLCEAKFSSLYTLTRTIYHKRLNAEAAIRTQSSIKLHINEICKM